MFEVQCFQESFIIRLVSSLLDIDSIRTAIDPRSCGLADDSGWDRSAINGDTVLVDAGIYSENLDFHAKAITGTSRATSYQEASSTVLNGVGALPTVSLVTGETRASILNGFTIQNAATAAVLLHSSATLTNNAILNNVNCAVVVYGSSSSPLISRNRIAGTTFTTSTCRTPDLAAASGVALNIEQAGDVVISDNLIEDNQASSLQGIVGGAIVSEFSNSITLLGNTI